MKSKRNKEEKYKIMTELQYIDVSYTNALCTLDTIIRVTEGPAKLYTCEKCIYREIVDEHNIVCPHKLIASGDDVIK